VWVRVPPPLLRKPADLRDKSPSKTTTGDCFGLYYTNGYTDALLVEGVVHGVRSLLYHSGERVRIGGESRVGGYVSGVVSPLMALR
jgi:hypothetical protein